MGTHSTKARGAGSPDLSALLLSEGLAPAEVQRLLAPYGFRDARRADQNLQAMAGEPRSRVLLAKIVEELLDGVARSADPDQALNHWERFVEVGLNRTQLFDYLGGSPRMLELLCSVFGNSPAMAQTLIRDPVLVYWLAEQRVLSRRPTRAALAKMLSATVDVLTTEEVRLEALRRFKRREMLRIGVRDLLKLADVRETIAALSDLAIVLIQGAYQIVLSALHRAYGAPTHRNREGRLVQTGFAVIAMGKLGGGELNFSSDVDVIYVSESDEGWTMGKYGRAPSAQPAISNEEFFEYLARDLTKALSEATQEGYIFRVDLRLRAEGSVGKLSRSLDDYRRYYQVRGQHWERMALLKAQPVAGSVTVGRAFLRMARAFIRAEQGQHGGAGVRETVVDQVKAIKTMIDGKMAERGLERRHVKLGFGGIREIEFLIQAIQVLCGRAVPGVYDRSTLGALDRFKRHRFLSAREHAELTESYVFLRDVEHKLQMVHDLQTHALPVYDEELARCAIRLGYDRGGERPAAMRKFLDDYARHTGRVHRIFEDLVADPKRSRLLKVVRARLREA